MDILTKPMIDTFQLWIFNNKPCLLLHFPDHGIGKAFSRLYMTSRKRCSTIAVSYLIQCHNISFPVTNHTHIHKINFLEPQAVEFRLVFPPDTLQDLRLLSPVMLHYFPIWDPDTFCFYPIINTADNFIRFKILRYFVKLTAIFPGFIIHPGGNLLLLFQLQMCVFLI